MEVTDKLVRKISDHVSQIHKSKGDADSSFSLIQERNYKLKTLIGEVHRSFKIAEKNYQSLD